MPDTTIQSNRRSGCLTLLIVGSLFVVALVYLIGSVREATRKRFEQETDERRIRFFETVKRGDDGGKIFILDPLLIEMLGNDPDCVSNLTYLCVDFAEITGPHVAAARKLTNVKTIYFYSSVGAENLLKAMKGMASVEEVTFETTRLSDEAVNLLASFPNLRKVVMEQVVGPEQEALLRKSLPRIEVQIPYREAAEPKSE